MYRDSRHSVPGWGVTKSTCAVNRQGSLSGRLVYPGLYEGTVPRGLGHVAYGTNVIEHSCYWVSRAAVMAVLTWQMDRYFNSPPIALGSLTSLITLRATEYKCYSD